MTLGSFASAESENNRDIASQVGQPASASLLMAASTAYSAEATHRSTASLAFETSEGDEAKFPISSLMTNA